MTSTAVPHSRRPSLGILVVSGLLISSSWILFVGGTRLHEMLVGFGVLVLSVAFLFRLARMESLNLDFRVSDLLTCWRIPWYILSDSWVIIAVLMKDLAGIQEAGSFYRFSGFKTARHNPRMVARSVLATGYTTATPNSIVIGIDVEQSRMFFHQLKRSKVSRMAKELGAQPGVDRS